MTTLFVISILLTRGASESSWQDQLCAASRAALGDMRITGKNAPPDTKVYTEAWQKIADIMEARKRAVAKSEALSAQGQHTEALQPLLAYLELNPSDASMRMAIADNAFSLKAWNTGYRVLAPELDANGTFDFVFRASLFAAMRGEAYAGQREYLVGAIVKRSSAFKDDLTSSIPQAGSNRELALLSLLAIGAQDAGYGGMKQENVEKYLYTALEWDPGNPYASYVLGKSFINARRHVDAILVLEPGLGRAEGKLKKSMQKLLKIAKKGASPTPPGFTIGGG